jgi:hypothetical protein
LKEPQLFLILLGYQSQRQEMDKVKAAESTSLVGTPERIRMVIN